MGLVDPDVRRVLHDQKPGLLPARDCILQAGGNTVSQRERCLELAHRHIGPEAPQYDRGGGGPARAADAEVRVHGHGAAVRPDSGHQGAEPGPAYAAIDDALVRDSEDIGQPARDLGQANGRVVILRAQHRSGPQIRIHDQGRVVDPEDMGAGVPEPAR